MDIYNNIFSENDLNYINNLAEVIDAKNKLKPTDDKVSFSITLTDSIRSALSQLGIDLINVTTIPMRWISGDTQTHIDSGRSKFNSTYLVFMNNSPGTFEIANMSYTINKNIAYVFNEGLAHSTKNTEGARLLVGPMNEHAEPVGSAPPCFNTGTQILCLNEKFEEVYVPVENLRSGNIVKTYIEGYRRIHLIGKGSLINNSSELHCMYKLSKINYKTLVMTDDLIVTGDHAIMIDKAYADGERVKNMYDKVLVVAKESPKFTKIINNEAYTYYHFSLENDGFVDRTFVVYANGALAETTSEAQFGENKLTLIV